MDWREILRESGGEVDFSGGRAPTDLERFCITSDLLKVFIIS